MQEQQKLAFEAVYKTLLSNPELDDEDKLELSIAYNELLEKMNNMSAQKHIEPVLVQDQPRQLATKTSHSYNSYSTINNYYQQNTPAQSQPTSFASTMVIWYVGGFMIATALAPFALLFLR